MGGAEDQIRFKASRNLGIKAQTTFSGALAKLIAYACRSAQPVCRDRFRLACPSWTPILDYADRQGIDTSYDIRPARTYITA
jgi:hypothetical protein